MQIIRTLIYVLLLSVFTLPAYAIDENRDMANVLHQAQTGNIDAQFKLGYLYQSRSKDQEDLLSAMRWYEKAATHGHANAAFALGLMYEYGQGTEINMGKAADWYIQAAQIYTKRGSDIPLRLAKDALKRTYRDGVRLAKVK